MSLAEENFLCFKFRLFFLKKIRVVSLALKFIKIIFYPDLHKVEFKKIEKIRGASHAAIFFELFFF